VEVVFLLSISKIPFTPFQSLYSPLLNPLYPLTQGGRDPSLRGGYPVPKGVETVHEPPGGGSIRVWRGFHNYLETVPNWLEVILDENFRKPPRQKFFEFSPPLQRRGMITSSVLIYVVIRVSEVFW
jgi:hypothetical protein